MQGHSALPLNNLNTADLMVLIHMSSLQISMQFVPQA
jgi:hypothetical protein